jgi:hypothetical protein
VHTISEVSKCCTGTLADTATIIFEIQIFMKVIPTLCRYYVLCLITMFYKSSKNFSFSVFNRFFRRSFAVSGSGTDSLLSLSLSLSSG